MGKKQNTKSAGKWVTVSVALFLAFVLIVGLCLQVFATNEKFKPSEWFKKDEQTEELPEEGGENAFVQDKKESGIKLMSARAATSSAYKSGYTLTATVLPEDADNKLVTWSIAWENPASAWATGKSVRSYVTAEVKTTGWIEDDNFDEGGYVGTIYKDISQSDGTSLEARISVLQAFGEPIVVTVQSQDDETKTASVKFGYVARIDKMKSEFDVKTQGDWADEIVLGDNQRYEMYSDLAFTTGTVIPNYAISYACEFLSYGGDHGAGLVDDYGKEYEIANNGFDCTEDFFQNCFTRTVSVAELKSHIAKFGNGSSFSIRVTVTLSTDLATTLYEQSYTKFVRFTVNTSLLKIGVNSVTVDQSGELYF